MQMNENDKAEPTPLEQRRTRSGVPGTCRTCYAADTNSRSAPCRDCRCEQTTHTFTHYREKNMTTEHNGQGVIPLNDAAPAKARRDDPVESHAAAASVKAEHISKLKRAILRSMSGSTGMSDECLIDTLDGADNGFQFTEAGARSRRAELQARGYIEDTDKLGVTSAGRACRLRRLTEAGRKEVGL
jgi:hypothetical protein